jgi:hypothetical protein
MTSKLYTTKAAELDFCRKQLARAQHVKRKNENSMSDWAVSGQMNRDHKAVVHWANRVRDLEQEIARCAS